jgi:PAS domain-containing protein
MRCREWVRALWFCDFFCDISKRIAAENQLAKPEIKFRTLYASSSEVVMLLEERGFFDCNQACLTLFGCRDLSEFCTKQLVDLTPPLQADGEDSLLHAQAMISTAFAHGSNRFECLHRRG